MTLQRAPRVHHRQAASCPEETRWPALLPTLESSHWPTPPATGTTRLARCPLNSDLGSPRVARDFTRGTLDEWSVPDVYCEASVVVSELVTNALRYGLPGRHRLARAPIQLILMQQEKRVLAIVTDPSGEAPSPGEPDDFAENGRGLQVVAAVSEAWGWAPLATGGKAVWASFPLPAA
ncbi:ATP-binding protein [Actinocorallia longicatena]|uniref:ATP-binding protein n=1 Tax=Actinocorallia longicatena TaxID=111803 RepID=A0ABP6Q993_9ACTN